MKNENRCGSRSGALIRGAVAVFGLALSVNATAGTRLVVYKSGEVRLAMSSNVKVPNCSEPNIAFVIESRVAAGTPSSVNAGQASQIPVIVDACSAPGIEGSVSLSYGLIPDPRQPASFPGDVRSGPAASVSFVFPPADAAEVQRALTFSISSTSQGNVRFGPALLNGGFEIVAPVIAAGAIPGDLAPFGSVLVNVPIGTTPIESGNLDGGTAASAATAVNSFCSTTSNDVCTATLDANSAAAQGNAVAAAVVENNVVEIVPTETTGIQNTVGQMTSAQSIAVLGRMRAMLDSGGVNRGGLALSLESGEFPLGTLLGSNGESSGAEGILDERFGGWVSANFGRGDIEAEGSEAAFEFDNWSLTAGIDYSLANGSAIGGAVGYSRMGSDFDRDDGELDADSKSLHFYYLASVSGLDLSANLSATWGTYDQERVQNFQRFENGQAVQLSTSRALAEVDFSQRSAAVNASYTLEQLIGRNKSTVFRIRPQLQYEFLSTDIDGFRERGDSPFLLAVDDQHLVTRSYSVGVHSELVFATMSGTYVPFVRAMGYADSGTTSYAILARFLDNCDERNGSCQIAIFVDEPDRRYATAELGMNYWRPFGGGGSQKVIQMNFSVMQLLGFDTMDRWAARADVRWRF